MEIIGCNQSDCFLCKNCMPEWKEMIGLKKENKLYKKGAKIFRENDPVEGIYFVYSGLVKVHMKWAGQDELILRFSGTGDIFGYRALPSEVLYPIGATALVETEVCYIPLDFWKTLIRAKHTLTYKLMDLYAHELHTTEIRMRSLVQMEAKGRISKALLEIGECFGINQERQLNYPISRQDIASYAGTTYETVFRFFNELIQKKIISTDGKKMKLLDMEKLKAFVP